MDLLLKYEDFLFRKGYDAPRLRHNAKRYINVKNSLGKKVKDGHEKKKTKSKEEFREELINYFNGNSVKLEKYEDDLEEEEKNEFWEWKYCFAFKNPDAQK